MISAISSATTGLLAASQRFDQAAQGVAQAGTGAGAADPAAAIEQALVAKQDFSVNAALLRMAADSERQVLDILI